MARRHIVLALAVVLPFSAIKAGWAQEPTETTEAAVPYETPVFNVVVRDKEELPSSRQHFTSASLFPSVQLDQPQQVEFEFTAAQPEIKFTFDLARGFPPEEPQEEDGICISSIFFPVN